MTSTALRRPAPEPAGHGSFAHADPARTWEYDSVRGVRRAAKRAPIGDPGRAVDINTTGRCAGVLGRRKKGPWCPNHWPFLLRDGGWRDPKRKVSKNRRIDTIPFRVLARFLAGPADDPYHVERLVDVLREAWLLRVRVELEAKTRESLADWQLLARNRYVRKLLEHDLIVVKTLANMPGAAERLAPAHAAGFPTMLSFSDYEGDPLPAETYWPITTYTRGTPRWAHTSKETR